SYKSMRSSADGLERRVQTPRYAMLGGGFQPRLQRQLRGIELRQDLAAEAFDQRVFLPLRPLAQRAHRRARLGALAHAFERLVVLVFEQRIEAGGLRLVVQQVAAEDPQQPRLGQERRQREEHEVAFRALPAPAVGRLGAEQLEVAVAAGEHVEVRRELRERTGDRQFRVRPQQRAVVEVGGHVRVQPVAQQLLEGVALAPLVVHLLAFVFQRGGGGGALVGEGDGVVAVEDRRHGEDRRVHRGDRDVAIPRAALVQLEQRRRQLALDVQRGQAGALGAGGDQRRVADPHRGGVAADGLDRLHRDKGILAAADGDEGALGQAERWSLWRGCPLTPTLSP